MEKFQFLTQFNVNCLREREFSNHGSIYTDLCVLDYDENGCQCLKCVGKKNIYADIQSHRESCDLNLILSRLDPQQVNGAMSTYDFGDILNSDIVDVTKLPRNAGDMLNMVKSGQQLFDGLPIEIREEFNFSPHKFISEFGKKSFIDRINALNARLYSSVIDGANTFSAPMEGVDNNE